MRLGRGAVLLLAVLTAGCATSHEKRASYHYTPAYGVASPEFERVLVAQGGELPDGNRAMLLNNGDEFFSDILEAIRGARASVNIEVSIFTRGRIAEVFGDTLCAKAQDGVPVRLLVDSLGARLGGLEARMKAAGVHLQIYKPARLRSLPKTGDRTHRKIIVVDGRVGFTGGLAIDDRWAGNARCPTEWRETVVRVEGPVVFQLQRLFLENWLYATGEFLDGEEQFPVVDKPGTLKAQAVGSSRTSQLSMAKLHYYMPIQAARKEIWIENAYFLPDKDLKAALIAAALRGVDVRLVVPGRHIDIKPVLYASQRDYSELLQAGVKIFEYQPAMMHSKVMVVDDLWSSIGSINFTARSMKANAEANIAFYDPVFAGEVKAMIEADMAQCQPILWERWKRRGPCQRLREYYWGLFRNLF